MLPVHGPKMEQNEVQWGFTGGAFFAHFACASAHSVYFIQPIYVYHVYLPVARCTLFNFLNNYQWFFNTHVCIHQIKSLELDGMIKPMTELVNQVL